MRTNRSDNLIDLILPLFSYRFIVSGCTSKISAASLREISFSDAVFFELVFDFIIYWFLTASAEDQLLYEINNYLQVPIYKKVMELSLFPCTQLLLNYSYTIV
jgi:hypothetical protein